MKSSSEENFLSANQKSENFRIEGNLHFKHKDFLEALKFYDKALTLTPKEIILYTNKASVYIGLKKYEEALKMCEKAEELMNTLKYKDNDIFSKVYMRKGKVFSYLNKNIDAIMCYKLSLKYKNDNIIENEIKILENFEKSLKEITINEDNMNIDNEKAMIYNDLGQYILKNKDFDKAESIFDLAIKKNPFNNSNYLYKGLCLMNKKKYNEAILHLTKSIQLDLANTNVFKAYVKIGDCQLLLGERKKAIESYTCAEFQINFDSKKSEKIRKRIAKASEIVLEKKLDN